MSCPDKKSPRFNSKIVLKTPLSIKNESNVDLMEIPNGGKLKVKLKSSDSEIKSNYSFCPKRKHIVFYKQLDMLIYVQEHSSHSTQDLFVAYDVFNSKENKWIKRYSYFPDPDKFFCLYLRDDLKTYNEMLVSNCPVRPGWDIEWYSFPDLPSPNPYIVLYGLIYYITQTCETLFEKSLNEDYFRVLESHKFWGEEHDISMSIEKLDQLQKKFGLKSHLDKPNGKTKYSFHVNICGYGYLPDHHVSSKALTSAVIQSIGNDVIINQCYDENRKQIIPIDTCIYTNNRLMRMLGHHKQNEINRCLKKIKEHSHFNDVDFLWSYTINELPIDTSKLSHLVWDQIPYQKNQIKSVKSEINMKNDCNNLDTNRLIGLFQHYHPDSHFLGSKMINCHLIVHDFSKSDSCCLICRRIHKNNRQYLIHNNQSKNILYKCHDDDAKNKQIYLVNLICPKMEPDLIINSENLPEYEFKNIKCLMIGSKVGTGKTINANNFLSKLPPNANVLQITYRVTLSQKYLTETKKFGFINYIDVKKKQIQDERVIIQLDSLHRLAWDLQHWDVIIIDEIDSVLGHFNSPLMKNKNMNADILKQLVESSSKCLLLDANITTDRVCDFALSICKREEIHYLQNSYIRPNNRQVKILQNKDQLLNLYMQSLKNGENVVFVSTSKKFLKELEKIAKKCFPNLVLLFYTSETDRQTLMFDSQNANQSWIIGNGLHFTPTYSAGVSFTLPHFDKLYVYGGPGGCEALTLFQMMFRVRQLKQGDMIMYLDPRKNNLPTSFVQVEKFIESVHNEIYYKMGEDYIHREISSKKKFYYPIKDWKYKLYINNLVSKFRSENNFRQEIINLLSQMLIPIIYDESVPSTDIKLKINKERTSARELIRSEKINLIMETEIPSKKEYEELKNISQYQKLEVIQQAAMLKYYVRQVYQIDESLMTSKFIDKYADHKVIHQYINRCKITFLQKRYAKNLYCSDFGIPFFKR